MKKRMIHSYGVLLLLGASVFFVTCENAIAKEGVFGQETRPGMIKQHSRGLQSKAMNNDDDAELQAQLKNAKKIAKVFSKSLKGTLQKAMMNGGPVNAVSACNISAIPITEKVAKENGVQLSRVSLKNRNTDNAPNDWQRPILESFDARVANGEEAKTLVYAEITEENGKKQFRFMKALPTGGVCLTCHGSNLDATLSSRLTELYPHDKAKGYSLGQVRGALVIVNDLE